MDNQTYNKFQKAKKENDFNSMKELYEQVNDKQIKFQYAKMLIKRKKYQEAENILLTIKNDTYALFELGKLEKILGNYNEAKKYFQRILKIKNDTYAKFELSKLEIELKNYETAKILLEEIIYENNDLFAKHILGKLETKMGNPEIAKQIFEEILTKKEDVHTRLELGKIERMLGNYEEARKHFENILKKQYDTYAILELGKLERKIGNTEKAKALFKELIYKNNSDCAKLELAILERNCGNNEEAIKYFNELLNSKYDKKSHLNLGIIAGENGNYTESKKHLEKALIPNSKSKKIDANGLSALRLLIVLNIKNNNLSQAVKYVNMAIDNNIEINLNILLYLSTKLNIFFKKYTNEPLGYEKYQYMDYDEFLAIEHIFGRHKTQFANHIDVYRLFNFLKLHLNDEYRVKKIQMNDIYYIPFERAGRNKENLIKVITLPNSKDILSMYPTSYEVEQLDQNEEYTLSL